MKSTAEAFLGRSTLRRFSANGEKIPCWWDSFGTLMFVRVAGYRSLPADPKGMEELHGQYFQKVFEVVKRLDGDICLVVGEDICGFFEAADGFNHAQQAIEAAQEIHRVIDRDSNSKFGLKTTIGVHTGSVSFGIVGTKELLRWIVLGQEVNLGGMLAGPRVASDQSPTILISQATAEKIPNRQGLQELRKNGVLVHDVACPLFTLRA